MQLVISDVAELPEVAHRIIEDVLSRHKIVCFYGQMGAGKTTLIGEICRQMGVDDDTSSPTFAIVNEYLTDDDRTIYHFDFYRINTINEAFDLGVEEYFYSGDMCFIEWGDKVDELLPECHANVFIDVVDNKRVISYDV